MKFLLFILLSSLVSAQVGNQNDSTLYGDKTDTLGTASVSASGQGNFLSKFKDVRTEVISASGLCKMACCNLAESFENSASVTVGYSDAVTGARQIRLLGLSGVYTQMLDENRAVMRGYASPFGLSYVPGQWLSSIQIAKGAPSVINGVESITGQINMEHRKPTDELPFFLNATLMSDSKMDLNLASSLQLNDKWSTVILGHVSGNPVGLDMNGDGILDDPKALQVNLANRWLYMADNGLQLRFGFKYLHDDRKGGEYDPDAGWNKKPLYEYYSYKENPTTSPWGSTIANQCVNAYMKLGIPLNPDNSQNIAVVADFNDYMMDSGFGATKLDASQISGFVNVLYQNHMWDAHHFTVGLNALLDSFNERLSRPGVWTTPQGTGRTNLWNAGAFGEYTFKAGDKFTAIAGARLDWYNNEGVRCSPRVTLKYAPIEEIVLRANGGRGLRRATPLADNIGVLSTSKFYSTTLVDNIPLFVSHPLEDAWVAGGNITFYMPFGASDNTYLSFDYFYTGFARQLLCEYGQNSTFGPQSIAFYLSNDKSYTNTYQLDFNVEPIKRFTITATFRYTDARVTYAGRPLQERPMTSRYKGVLNLQYATNLNKWIFDFTASVNGPCKVYDFMTAACPDYYKNSQSPVYPLLYLQVTHRMKGWDIFFGGENLTNFTQKYAVLGEDMSDPARSLKKNPASPYFDASCIWGPLMGVKLYLGVRISMWKKTK